MVLSIEYVVLTFESEDDILWSDHSNETSRAVLSHGSICFLACYSIKFGNFLDCLLELLLAVKEFETFLLF